MRPIHVVSVGFWSPGYPSLGAWLAGQRDGAATIPACAILPPRQRRATSFTTRMGVEVLSQVLDAAGVDRSSAMLLFGSAYGEFETAVVQLEMMAGDDGRLSPARFKNSVHNTVIGLLSIALENRGYSTAIAAGDRTFAMSLLEAWSVLDLDGGTVAMAVADDCPPEPFRADGAFPALGLGLCLTTTPADGASLATLSDMRRREGVATEPAHEFSGNPAGQGLAAVRAIVEGRSATVALDGGEAPWSLRIDAAGGRT